MTETKCGSSKMRALIEEHFGKEQLKQYDDTVDACKLGNALKDDRVWAPLCHSYPNLKGVTCEEIDEFVGERHHQFFDSAEYKKLVAVMRDPVMKKEHYRTPEERIKRFFFTIKKHMSEEEFDTFKKEVSIFGTVERMIERIENLKFTEHTQFAKDYLHHVKVYDRDEEYAAFKRIGEQIENDMPGVLHHPTTVFITTPRGGHEMLSIFAYANGIDKEQIPSDINWRHSIGMRGIHERDFKRNPYITHDFDTKTEFRTETYGKCWLGEYSDTIKNVFIVDDIIASGEQLGTAQNNINVEIPDAKVHSITLCKREDVPDKKIIYDDEEFESDVEIESYYNDTKTIGIKEMKKLHNAGNLGNEYITCLFPHACPDGSSDKLMVELMGEKRCSPEKRISRRDL